jgi:DNA-binding response OmpR family regulator
MNKPIIFLLEEDDHTRSMLHAMLRNRGYIVIPSASKDDAILMAEDGLITADVVLVDLMRKTPEETLEFGRMLLKHGKLNASLIVLAAMYGDDLEGTISQVGENEYIVHIGTGDELFDLISTVTKIDKSGFE